MMKFFVAISAPVFLLAGGTHPFAPITTASTRASRVLSVATAPHRTLFGDMTPLFADKSDTSQSEWESLYVVDGAELGECLARGLENIGKNSPDLLSKAGSEGLGKLGNIGEGINNGLGKLGLGLGLGLGLIGVGIGLGSISSLVAVYEKHKFATRAFCKGLGLGLGLSVLAAVAIRLAFMYSPWFRHFFGCKPDNKSTGM